MDKERGASVNKIAGVRFKKAGKIYYFSSENLEVNIDDGVIVETSRGMEYGRVVIFPKHPEIPGDPGELRPILRKATARDLVQVERNREREKEAFQICLDKIKKLKCKMKLLRVEYTFDRNKIVFFFTAEGRVDFRELVKELAAVFHTRIEMRQVGVRDEAKQVSGIGPCGRTLCCASFLGEFAPVSIKMAKTQGLSLNPSKISGVCGRLMCCLRYEDGMYKCGEIKGKGCGCHKKIVVPEPSVGMKVMTDKGEGQVVYVNHQKHTVKVQYPDQPEQILSWKEIDKSDD